MSDYCINENCKECSGGYTLPLQGRPERKHLYRWVEAEEIYVAAKFDDQRHGHDESMLTYDLQDFWIRQIVQYYDRAHQFLQGAKQLRDDAEKKIFSDHHALGFRQTPQCLR